MRTDNGGELYGNEFEEFCKNNDISGKKNTPYTHQWNGVSERRNRTLRENERGTLSSSRIR